MFDSLNSAFAKGGVTLARWASVAAVGAFTISAAHAGLSASISSPSNSSVYPSGTTSISASFSASDNTSGRIIASLSATLDGSSVSFSSPGPSGMGTQSVTASANLTVSNGQHTVVLTAEDQYGTQATATSTFNVGKLTQAAVSTQNASNININTSWSPYEQGGSGSGGWQFCISGATNWDGGVSSSTGTSLGTSQSPNWQPTWTTAQVSGSDNLTFYVVRDGDSNYNPSSYASGSLTLNAPVPGITFDTMAGSSSNYTFSGTAGGSGSFSGTATNSGTATWNSNYYMLLYDPSGNVVCFVPTGNVSPGGNASGTFTFTLPSTPGQYRYTFGALEQNVEYFGPNPTLTVSAYGNQAVSVSPSSQTITAGSSITFTASGGQNGYVWGGSASGSGSSQNVTFNTPGTAYVTVYSASGNYYNQSNIATATITVNAAPPPSPQITSPLSESATVGSYFSYTITATNNPTSFSATTGDLPPGLSFASPTISGTPTTANTYSIPISATNAGGTGNATLTITVGNAKLSQATVAIFPSYTQNVTANQMVTFSASGGSGTGNYVWGGAASGTGNTVTVTFGTLGAGQAVTVYRAADATYLQSNTASTTVNVTNATTNNASIGLKLLMPTN